MNRPYPLPAIVARPLAGGGAGSSASASGDSGGLYQATGLDGTAMNVRAVALADAIPGAPGNGIVVDRTYAERAAGISPGSVSDQVWLAPGALARVRPRLIAAGVRISGTETSAGQQSLLIRRGPALATVLFLADAAAAALLAAGAAILGLYLSGRRRRYEYAALAASRVSRGTLRRALLIEQAVVLGFGAVVGLASGFVATLLAIRSIPEFIAPPSSPPLSYTPVAGEFAALVGVALALLIIAAVAASIALVRSVRPDLLREAQP